MLPFLLSGSWLSPLSTSKQPASPPIQSGWWGFFVASDTSPSWARYGDCFFSLAGLQVDACLLSFLWLWDLAPYPGCGRQRQIASGRSRDPTRGHPSVVVVDLGGLLSCTIGMGPRGVALAGSNCFRSCSFLF